MQSNSIQRYLRFFGITITLLYLVVNQSFSQFHVGGKTCVDNTSGGTGLAGSGCNEPTAFFDTNLNSTAWKWTAQDSLLASPAFAIGSSRNPRYLFSKVGTYTISLTQTVGGVEQTPVTKNIKVGTFPTQPLFNKKKKTDTTVCSGKTKLNPYEMTATPAGVKFLWFPKGETTETIEVDSSGCYSVEVTSLEGCSRIAQITVKYCLQKPNKASKKEVWYFGDKGALEFTKSPFGSVPWDSLANSGKVFSAAANDKFTYSTQIPKTGNVLNSPESMAMVFGPQGNIIFYTNGKAILNGDNQPVPAKPPLTNKLNGDTTATQSVIIVPKSACNECPHHQYYVFVQDSLTKMLTYSVVDMRTKDKKGIIVEKNIPLYYPVGERIAGVMSSDSSGFYIISHSAKDNKFVISKLDSTGLTVREQSVGLPTSSPESNEGYLRFSPKGDKVAIVISDGTKNYVEVYKFDREKGSLELTPKRIDLPSAPPQVYGVEFSGNGEVLYVSMKGNTNDGISPPKRADSSFLYQLNLNLPTGAAISASKILIDSSATESFGALQIDPDGRQIYMAVNKAKNANGESILFNIQFPDILETKKTKGSLIGYDRGPIGGIVIAGTSNWGLPNVIKSKPKDDDDGPSASYSNTCQNSNTIFEASPICSPMTNKYIWDFGDGETKETDSKSVSHKYKNSGKYFIKLTIRTYEKLIQSSVISIPILSDITVFCRDTTLKDSLYIRPSPIVGLPDTLYVCVLEGEKKTLNATAKNGTNFTYLWKPTGETTPKIEVSAVAIYRVNVKNAEGCQTDTLSVVRNGCEPQVYIPSAFSPNEDGQNDKLLVISKYVTDFELRIFNRWGEQVFFTDNPLPENRWDGSYKGYTFAPMNYAYVIQFKSKDFPLRPKELKRGGILVVK
jgi:gliding motility-associated-like protein